ncbi:glycosyl transferase [Paraburkholderia monticola]|uniref:Glycosyl transferase n=1 Tax=Paraburkholderia monticola TaxID=1399968 RepID=A0A149Q0U3_9BURK|nr:glycosyltransferase family 2 protein [Paraburkholderia monticola]KXU90950.1 glycosyl transferase [Paraburkholderia monticola]
MISNATEDTPAAKIAVLIPCYNEQTTIRAVVQDFAAHLPDASIYVFDNNSSDATIERAREAGATIRSVPLQGKGNVVRRMFADVDADVYVVVDGDDTYDAADAPAFVDRLLAEDLDMVVGARVSDEDAAYRRGHRFGNVMLTKFAAHIFGNSFSDMLSGYRVFSRRFAKSFAAHSKGFEIETELAVHALELRMPVQEMQTRYKARPAGSASKLNTYRDGARILFMTLRLFKAEKPLAFFSIGFAVCALASIVLAVPVLQTFIETGLVPRLPTALLCAALMLFGALLLVCGLVSDTITRGRAEAKRLVYLSFREPSQRRRAR